MNENAYVLSEASLPMDVVGWTVLIVSLLITLVWLRYVYR